MENAIKEQQRRGTNIYDDKGARMPFKPPTSIKPGQGKLSEDLGATAFLPPKHVPSLCMKSRVNTRYPRKNTQSDIQGESDDELNIGPSSSRAASPDESPGIIIDGKHHKWHKDYQPEKETAVKKLSFSKKSTNAVPAVREIAQPNKKVARRSTPPDAKLQPRKNPQNLELGPSSISEQKQKKSDGPNTHRIYAMSPPQSKSYPSPDRVNKDSTFDGRDYEKTPRPKPRLKYRTAPKIVNQSSPFPSLSPLSMNSESKKSLAPFPTVENFRALDGSTNSPPRRKTKPFPSLSSPVGKDFNKMNLASSSSPNTASASSQDPFSSLSPLSSSKNPIDDLSPINKRQRSPKLRPLPASLPALSMPKEISKETKRKDRSSVRDEGHLETSRQHNLEAFPMETQELKSIGAVERLQYAIRGSRQATDQCIDMSISDVDLSHLFLDPDINPESLCPYCDEPLPAEPTPLLTSLLASVLPKSHLDPRPSNPMGRKAPSATFIAVCQRHRFEAVWLPKARLHGWPTQLDFTTLRKRVERIRPQLKAILDDSEPSWRVVPDVKGHPCHGPRNASSFWQETLREVRTKGTKVAAGVAGQFESFEKTQPGYYGEMGRVIIHQTLYNIFPPEEIDPGAVTPLTPADFIQRVLLPEVAVTLIKEDLQIDREEAIQTLRDSVQYGVVMFPDDGAGATSTITKKTLGTLGEGEKMMRDRARARRKVIEEEERIEELMRSESERAASAERSSDSEPDVPAVIPARLSGITLDRRKREADEAMLSSESRCPSHQPRSSKRRKARKEDFSSSSESIDLGEIPLVKRSAKILLKIQSSNPSEQPPTKDLQNTSYMSQTRSNRVSSRRTQSPSRRLDKPNMDIFSGADSAIQVFDASGALSTHLTRFSYAEGSSTARDNGLIDIDQTPKQSNKPRAVPYQKQDTGDSRLPPLLRAKQRTKGDDRWLLSDSSTS